VALRDPETGYLPSSAYGPDDLWNYEIGLKTRDWHGLRASAALFYITWNDIQLTRRQSITTYTENAGNAVSKGFELEVEGEPLAGVHYGFSAAYIDAKLKRVSAGLTIQPGDLPGAPRWSASAFLELRKALDASRAINFRVDQRYVGSRDAGLEQPLDVRAERTPPYLETDASIGIESRSATFRLFARNIFNSSAAAAVRELSNTPTGALRQTPRTTGLQVRYLF
jgi:outer membrane receptor protein involved in Fe transport